MVKRFLHILHKEIRGLHEAAYLLGLFAVLSQLLGLVRDKLLAYYFGAGHVLDVYYAGFRIPDLIFVSIASMVSASVLVPFFIDKMQQGQEEGKRFIDNVFSIFFFAILISSAVVFLFVPKIIPLILPGFAESESKAELIAITRILLLSPIFLGLSNFFASITQMYNRFFIYAISPLFYNLGIIVGIVAFQPLWGIRGLAYGVVLGALMHFLTQVPYVAEKKLLPRIRLSIDYASIKKVVLLSFPRTLTLSSNQIATFFLTAFASLMAVGSISVLNLSLNLQSVPLGIIGVSYSSAAFPTLARLFSSGERQKFIDQMIVSARHIIFWSTPIMVLFVVLRAQIVRTILGAGRFSWSDTKLTAAAFALFTFSVIGQSLVLLFIRAYYSGGNTKKPLFINLFSSALIVVLAYVFITLFKSVPLFQYFFESLFKVDDLPGSVMLMLPLAYSTGVLVNTVLHWIIFHRDYPGFTPSVIKTLFQSLSAAIIMGYVAYLGLNLFDNVLNINTGMGIFLQGFFAGVLGIIAGILVLLVLRNQEIKEVWKTLHAKVWKAKVIAPEQNTLIQ
jgi:putative peptidoglycan lipid II flippase